MALVSVSIGAAVVTPTAEAAPTTEETIAASGPGVLLQVTVGGTATTITVARPGTHPGGDAIDDLVLSALSNTTRIIPILREYRDPSTGLVTVTFSQVTNVTARVLRVGRVTGWD